ncbi:MAG: peptide deformylase [Bacillota bacterium]
MIYQVKLKKQKILNFGDPVLRQVSKPVTVFHNKLHSLIDSMAATLHSRDDGAALAAPQIGVLKRIVVIDYMDEYLELINPEIIYSDGEKTDFEGCLSLTGYFGKVKRADKIKVKYLDRNGKEHVIERKGLFSRCIQHELDHLDGVLFIDRVKEEYLIGNEDKKISLRSVMDIANGESPDKRSSE